MLHLLQTGEGPRRLLVIAYFCANKQALLDALPPSACVLIDNDSEGGRFARPVGAGGGVDALGRALVIAKAQAGDFALSARLLIGYSAGCQAVRAQLRAGEQPEAVLALDGTSGDWPHVLDSQVDPWKQLAERARANQALFVLTHTQQTYTEHRGAGSFASTLTIARRVSGLPLLDAGPIDEPVEHGDEGFRVLSYASASIDAAAHIAQQTTAMPAILRGVVVPWLEEHFEAEPTAGGSPVQSAPEVPLRFGEHALEAGLRELDAGVREVEENWSTRIETYFDLCVRGGRFSGTRLVGGRRLGIKRGAWCSAGAGFCDVEASKALPGVPFPPPRGAVRERIEDAKALGIWEPAGSGYVPRRGDLAVFARFVNGAWQEPEHGGYGHVARVIDPPDEAGAYRTLDANLGDTWTQAPRRTDDDDLRGWIRYP